MLGAIVTAAVGIGVARGISSSGSRNEEERQLAYVASQIGVPSVPSLVSAVFDKQTGRVTAVAVVGQDGRRYLATRDPIQPSRLLLASQKGGEVYALQTRYGSLDLNNRRQMETIFRVADWEARLERLE